MKLHRRSRLPCEKRSLLLELPCAESSIRLCSSTPLRTSRARLGWSRYRVHNTIDPREKTKAKHQVQVG
jgi:hypothetical protein